MATPGIGLAGLAAALAALALAVPDASGAARRTPPPPQCPSAGTKPVAFASMSDGGAFLAGDGTEVRLAGIAMPDAEGERVSVRAALATFLSSAPLALAAEPAPDRYGRSLAQVFADGAWVQGELLRRGEVRAAPELASAPCAKALLQAEEDARQGRRGRWGDGTFAVLAPEQLRNRTGTYQIVEGTVAGASVNMGRAYINFGADYRSDFTVTVSPADMRAFRQARFDVRSLAGKRIRVRGWLDFYNGPEMEIATPRAIEVLE